MAQYTKQQLQLIKTVLLRPLNAGEQFKVDNPLTRHNVAESMRDFEGEWVTVFESKHDEDGNYGYFNQVYYNLQMPIFIYKIKEEMSHKIGFQYSWLDYHMNIYATNLRIMELDRANRPFLKQEPQMPII